jgi:Sap, sulfolipid-1-addressing protein
MSGDLVDILLLALVAACYPTLLAAVTVMLLLPDPKRLMFGYLLGAYTTSITLGILVVYSIGDSAAANSQKHTISPAQNLVLGGLFLLVAFVLGTGRDEGIRRRRNERKDAKRDPDEEEKPPLTERMLGSGSPRVTYVAGVLLSVPGLTYLLGMSNIAALDVPVAPTVLLVIAFAMVQQILLEMPLLGFVFAPDRTQAGVQRFRAWLARNGRRGAFAVAATLGSLLVLRGVLELLHG